MNEVTAPAVAALSKANDALKDKIKTKVYELVNQKHPDSKTASDCTALIIYGEK